MQIVLSRSFRGMLCSLPAAFKRLLCRLSLVINAFEDLALLEMFSKCLVYLVSLQRRYSFSTKPAGSTRRPILGVANEASCTAALGSFAVVTQDAHRPSQPECSISPRNLALTSTPPLDQLTIFEGPACPQRRIFTSPSLALAAWARASSSDFARAKTPGLVANFVVGPNRFAVVC